MEGSTDITRTIALGRLTREQKLHFTTVCRSNLNLAAAKFLYGCRGSNLDILARGPLWDLGLDYKCGTGHGMYTKDPIIFGGASFQNTAGIVCWRKEW